MRYSIFIPSIIPAKCVHAKVHGLNIFYFPHTNCLIIINGFLHVQVTPCTYNCVIWQFKDLYCIGKLLRFTYLLHLHLKTDFHVEGSYPYLTCGTGQRSAVVFTERKPTQTVKAKDMSNLGDVISWTFKHVCDRHILFVSDIWLSKYYFSHDIVLRACSINYHISVMKR